MKWGEIYTSLPKYNWLDKKDEETCKRVWDYIREKEIKFYRCDKGAEPQYAVDIKDAAEFEMCPWTHPIEAVVNSFIYHRHLRCAQLMADANEIYKARTKEYEEQINKQDATKNEAPSAEEYAEIMITTELADPVLRTTLSPQQQAKNILKRLEATGIKVSYDEEVFYAQPSS